MSILSLLKFVQMKTNYTPDIADEICERMSSGENLLDICESLKVRRHNVSDWARRDKDGFYAKYTRARQLQIEYMLDDILRKTTRRDDDFFVDNEGKLHTNHAAIQRDRLIVDTLKWVACKVVPKMPSFKGTLVEMGNNVIQGVENDGLPLEQAGQMMRLVQNVAEVKKVDEFDEVIKQIPQMQAKLDEFALLRDEKKEV